MGARGLWAWVLVALVAAQACGGDDGSDGSTSSGAGATSSSSSGVGGQSDSCVDNCSSMFPAGVNNAQLMADCVVCGACYDACDGGVGDVCPTGSDLGCSADASTCDECLSSGCAYLVDLNTMTTSGVCAAEAQGCIDNPQCLDLLDCLSMCPG